MPSESFKINSMKRMAGIAGLGMIFAMAWAAGGGVVFKDKEGNLEIRDLGSWKVTRVNEKSLAFRGTGSPFVGFFRSQGMTVRARSIEGTMTRFTRGYELDRATIRGGVNAEIAQKGSGRTSDLKGDTLVIQGGKESTQATLTGNVTVRSEDPTKSQVFTMSGSSAVASLLPFGAKSDWPLQTLELKGPVKMRLQTAEKTESGKANPVDLKGTADRLSYNDADRTITLYGNVFLEGTDSSVGGTSEASRVVVRLTNARLVESIEFFGEPGRTTLKEQDKP